MALHASEATILLIVNKMLRLQNVLLNVLLYKVYYPYYLFVRPHQTDIDECSENACDQESTICHNTHGGFSCQCKRGFTNLKQTICSG